MIKSWKDNNVLDRYKNPELKEKIDSKERNLKESLVNSYIVINKNDATIVSILKDEERAELKAKSFNAVVGENRFTSCPFTDIQYGNYKFSRELLNKICDHFAESKKLKESKPKFVECKIYSYYATYFMHGDTSGLTDNELEDCRALESAIEEYTGCYQCVDVKDDADFGDVEIPSGMRCREFNGVKFLPGSVATFVFQKRQ